MYYLLLFVLGLMFGSFVTAYSYRYPRLIGISKGRSRCPKCKHKIVWYDNLPLLSYFLLHGKCRNCSKSISKRYPFIELTTGVLFVGTGYFYGDIVNNLEWVFQLQMWGLPYLLLIVVAMTIVLVTDFESQIIPDLWVFVMLVATFFAFIVTSNEGIYVHLLSGFGASLFLLLIHLITKGKGMGLGDVKLAIPAGMILGVRMSFVWMFGAFVIGAVVGLFLMFFSDIGMKDKIAFGPFLVISFFITLVYGEALVGLLLPI